MLQDAPGRTGDAFRVAVAAWLALLALLAGPPGCTRPPLARPSSPPDLGSEVFQLLTGVVVDVNGQSGAFIMKSEPGYETWTVSIDEDSRIMDTTGNFIPLGQLEPGDGVRVRGRSRVEGFLTALEVLMNGRAAP